MCRLPGAARNGATTGPVAHALFLFFFGFLEFVFFLVERVEEFLSIFIHLK